MTYPGGKSGAGVYQAIINQMPPHREYIEPFLGSGSVLRLKRPAEENVGIEIDPEVAERAYKEITFAQILKGNGIDYLQRRVWSGGELVYCDPPYVMSSRKTSRPRYLFEMTDGDHRELLGTLKTLPCMVMISGYQSDLYEKALVGWRVVTFQTTTRGGSLATEYLWMNYEQPTQLHDYRFVGTTYRDRDRIKRKMGRWKKKLQAMIPSERLALSAALAEVDERYRNVKPAAVRSPFPIMLQA